MREKDPILEAAVSAWLETEFKDHWTPANFNRFVAGFRMGVAHCSGASGQPKQSTVKDLIGMTDRSGLAIMNTEE